MAQTDPSQRVIGWKSIAALLGHDKRTVMRWEDTRGLPIHRAPGDLRSLVFAYEHELRDWLSRRGTDTAEETPTVSPPPPQFHPRAAPYYWWRRATAGAAGLACLIFVGWTTIGLPRQVASARLSSYTSDPVARDLYLRGRAAWSRRTPASLEEATQLFGDAVARDPRMADAYVGLADAWLLRREFAAVPQPEAYARADAAIRAALAIDPALPGAIRARGFVDFWGRRDEKKGLAELRRAAALTPNDAQSHHWLATATGTAGNLPESLSELDAARAIEPANPAILVDRASCLLALGRRADAAAAYREVIAAYPEQSEARAGLATILLKMGDTAGYARMWAEAEALRGAPARAAIFREAANAFAPAAAPSAKRAMAFRAEAAFRAGWLPASEAAELVSLAGNRVGARVILNSQEALKDAATLTGPLAPH